MAYPYLCQLVVVESIHDYLKRKLEQPDLDYKERPVYEWFEKAFNRIYQPYVNVYEEKYSDEYIKTHYGDIYHKAGVTYITKDHHVLMFQVAEDQIAFNPNDEKDLITHALVMDFQLSASKTTESDLTKYTHSNTRQAMFSISATIVPGMDPSTYDCETIVQQIINILDALDLLYELQFDQLKLAPTITTEHYSVKQEQKDSKPYII